MQANHKTEQTGVTGFFAHQAHTVWVVLHAVIAVLVGFATLNLFLADSGMAVLNEHAAPYLPFLARLTRQG